MLDFSLNLSRRFFLIQAVQQRLPAVLIEVKQTIANNIHAINFHHLGQLFVQSYYALRTHPLLKSLVVVLTDSSVYHFFKVEPVIKTDISGMVPLVNVLWAHTITEQKSVIRFLAQCLTLD